MAQEPADIDALLNDLSRWTGERLVDQAARSRTKERWLRQQQQEGAVFAGLVVDLVEQQADVGVRTVGGRLHAGVLSGAGADFVVVRRRDGGSTFVALSAIASLRPPPGHRLAEAASERTMEGASLAEAVIALAVDRPRVQVAAAGAAEPIAGELRAVGVDVVTIRLDGPASPPANVYLRLDALTELTVLS